jgi:hypothetical protein
MAFSFACLALALSLMAPMLRAGKSDGTLWDSRAMVLLASVVLMSIFERYVTETSKPISRVAVDIVLMIITVSLINIAHWNQFVTAKKKLLGKTMSA